MSDIRVRSYDACHQANRAKEQALVDLLPMWQRGLVHMQMVLVRRLRTGARLGRGSTIGMPDYLTQRQWKSVVNQVNGALRSWQELAVPLVRKHINNLEVDDAERHRLHVINLRHAWWSDLVTTAIIECVAFAEHRFPHMSGVRAMLMDGGIAQVETSRTSTFRWWVRVSLPGVRPVRIPLSSTPYMDAHDGKLRNFAQIIITEDTRVVIRLVKDLPGVEERTSGVTVGMDWGLTNLFTTSNGRRYGQQLFVWLKERDAEVTSLQSRLQSQGIKPRQSRRYRKLISRIRTYVRTEVNRILNTIADGDVRELVVEDLDFRDGGLSRQLNRIVSRAGRAAVRHKLDMLREDRGITVTKVNPAYTSQKCSGCGYVARQNRRSQATFVCSFCHKNLHADVNASRSIVQQRLLGDGMRNASKHAVLAQLDHAFATRWGCEAGRLRERQIRSCSRATSDLVSGVQLSSG